MKRIATTQTPIRWWCCSWVVSTDSLPLLCSHRASSSCSSDHSLGAIVRRSSSHSTSTTARRPDDERSETSTGQQNLVEPRGGIEQVEEQHWPVVAPNPDSVLFVATKWPRVTRTCASQRTMSLVTAFQEYASPPKNVSFFSTTLRKGSCSIMLNGDVVLLEEPERDIYRRARVQLESSTSQG